MKNFILIVLALACESITALSMEELKSMMGDKACVEGVLVTMPQGLTLVTSTAYPSKSNLPFLVRHEESEAIDDEQTLTNTTFVPTDNLGKTKKTTPLQLINELARYNKIDHQYRLISEEGEAHKKIFTVTLTLGNEEYEADGTSIKKAQHAVAMVALQQTDYEHLPVKANKNSGTLTPTVELNALATKRCEKVVYELDEPPGQGYIPQTPFQPRHNYKSKKPAYYYSPNKNYTIKNYRTSFENRYYNQQKNKHRPGELFHIRLRVGEREYLGTGYTVQAARHDAAAKAIEDIKEREAEESQQCVTNIKSRNEACNELNAPTKSAISLVHEIGLKKNFDIIFEVISEKGPPHMREFVTQCRVGEFLTEGEGPSKKKSKRNAAEKMVQELSKFGHLPNTNEVITPKPKLETKKKKKRNLIKDDQSADYAHINPISRLEEIQRAKKEKEPMYYVIEDRANSKNQEFVIQVSVNGHISTGSGPSKKIAKRNAAESLLVSLGYSNSPTQQFPSKADTMNKDSTKHSTSSSHTSLSDVGKDKQSQTRRRSHNVSAKDRLIHLAQMLGIIIQFSDFPKIDHKLYLTLISLSTNPPQVCQGEGPTTELSHEKAAIEALTVISELESDILRPNKKEDVSEIVNPPKPQAPERHINQNDFKES
ncbi:hypothetical protein RN001_011529 [Aquatica leii]|uniref:DRBM domain-containing protein n=1 Tax=Aquatica leii TaxID=1421715 RepID=A0AAN7PT28_9COLE|nr:hypothetical protein RN001_011529 [Aquatica leii]